MINFNTFEFAEVVKLPAHYHVLDMSNGPMVLPDDVQYAVGKYNEHRPNIYNTEQFQGERDHHIGVDIFGPNHTEIANFYDGVVYKRANNALALDYGYTLILEYELGGKTLYALFGHLNKASYDNNPPGKRVAKGEVFAWMGQPHENGGWPVHLHLQLSYQQPEVCDMPGVVSKADLAQALEMYPDPKNVLGQLY